MLHCVVLVLSLFVENPVVLDAFEHLVVTLGQIERWAGRLYVALKYQLRCSLCIVVI